MLKLMLKQVIRQLPFNMSPMRIANISISSVRIPEPIDAFIEAYGQNMYIDFMRHWTQTSEDAQVPEEELFYMVDFGYNADSEKKIYGYYYRTG